MIKTILGMESSAVALEVARIVKNSRLIPVIRQNEFNDVLLGQISFVFFESVFNSNASSAGRDDVILWSITKVGKLVMNGLTGRSDFIADGGTAAILGYLRQKSNHSRLPWWLFSVLKGG
jgi:hypothetical protein